VSDDDSFLARWSQRKREALRQAPPELEAEPVPVADETPLDLESLPKLEDLTGASDITAFLQKGIPASLRNAALRRVWALDPSVRDYVGDALDYAYDWNVPGGVPGSGEMTPGTDVAKLVSQIFGDKPDAPEEGKGGPGEKVIEHGAAQDDPQISEFEPQSLRRSEEEPREATNQNPEKLAAAITKDDLNTSGRVAAPHQNMPRHGSALPR
jgi:hypothetical protein